MAACGTQPRGALRPDRRTGKRRRALSHRAAGYHEIPALPAGSSWYPLAENVEVVPLAQLVGAK